jgi:hypothetical protein
VNIIFFYSSLLFLFLANYFSLWGLFLIAFICVLDININLMLSRFTIITPKMISTEIRFFRLIPLAIQKIDITATSLYLNVMDVTSSAVFPIARLYVNPVSQNFQPVKSQWSCKMMVVLIANMLELFKIIKVNYFLNHIPPTILKGSAYSGLTMDTVSLPEFCSRVKYEQSDDSRTTENIDDNWHRLIRFMGGLPFSDAPIRESMTIDSIPAQTGPYLLSLNLSKLGLFLKLFLKKETAIIAVNKILIISDRSHLISSTYYSKITVETGAHLPRRIIIQIGQNSYYLRQDIKYPVEALLKHLGATTAYNFNPIFKL